MNLGTILKMLGIKLPPDKLAQIEAMLPQVPAKINEVLKANQAAIVRYDEKLDGIERRQLIILDRLALIQKELADGRRTIRNVQHTGHVNGPGHELGS